VTTPDPVQTVTAAESAQDPRAEVSEQMQIRMAKRGRLLDSGREAYPVGGPR
jgi:lysyl-tRNA synthetase class 2